MPLPFTAFQLKVFGRSATVGSKRNKKTDSSLSDKALVLETKGVANTCQYKHGEVLGELFIQHDSVILADF